MNELPADHPVLIRSMEACERMHELVRQFLLDVATIGVELEEARNEIIETFETSSLGLDLYHQGAIVLTECASVVLGGPHESVGTLLARMLQVAALSERSSAEIKAHTEKQN